MPSKMAGAGHQAVQGKRSNRFVTRPARLARDHICGNTMNLRVEVEEIVFGIDQAFPLINDLSVGEH
jgi:hypothetical protein